jgi:membrane dipeptidase
MFATATSLYPPIADLHCDMLSYLSRSKTHSANDPSARCAIPQLREGNVKVQAFAIFTETNVGSSTKGWAQAEVFRALPRLYSDVFEIIRQQEQFDLLCLSNKIGILPAIENASSVSEETEKLELVFDRLKDLQRKIGKIAYISLTWNSENRFGGGAWSKVGLKEDGKRLIDYMHQHRIPLDFSHASDYLAFDILNYIDKTGQNLPILASHSNSRTIANVPRNIPDEIAKEIFKRKGIIGLNFIREFIGLNAMDFVKHLEHFLKLGGSEHLALGADFFHNGDLPPNYHKKPEDLFFPSYDNAGTYSRLIDLWRHHLQITEEVLSKICYHNAAHFFKHHIFYS